MGKNIIICCDGTGNEFGANNTNVVKMYQFAQKEAPDKQIAYYDPGVATGGWEYDESRGDVKAKYDGATGYGLQKNVKDAYGYLMEHYQKGDQIYLFGFSRGAFTARSLAGMLYKCGLLRPGLTNMIEYASKMYNTENNDDVARGFKETFSRPCPVHFIGVWDTVASLARDAGEKFHNTKLNEEVGHGCHAVALDEVRKKFPPTLWDDLDNVEQVWFAGVHSDVGGWYGNTDLSDIALKWMATKAESYGMLLHKNEVQKIKGNSLGMQHDSHASFWLAMGKHIRQLPVGAKIHESVRSRLGNSIIIADDKDAEQSREEYRPQAELNGESITATSKGIEWVDDKGNIV